MARLTYTPPKTVKNFIKEYLPGELFYNFIVGPVGSGKTTGLFFKLCYMAGLQEPSPVDGIRRTRAVIVRNTMPSLKDTTIRSFNMWFAAPMAGTWSATTSVFILKFGDCECEILFRALDTPDDISRVLSLEVTFAIIDEFIDIPKEIIEALSGRCGRFPSKKDGGPTNFGMWGSSNPGQEDSWWYEKLEGDEGLPKNWTYYVQPSGLSVEAENLDNLPGGVGYYTSLCEGKSDHWIKKYVECNWGYSLSGKPVFPMFNKDIHVSKKSLHANPALQLGIGYDPGVHSGLVLGQYTDWGQVVVLDELVLENYSTQRMIAERLKPLLRRKYAGYEVVIIPDPSSANRAQAVDNSVLKELKKHFAVKEDSNNVIATRLDPAQYYMMRLTSSGPALLIDPSCVHLIRALVGGYKYTVTKGEVQRDVPDKNKHSNIADGFTYLTRYFKSGEDKAGRRVQVRTPVQHSRNTYNMR